MPAKTAKGSTVRGSIASSASALAAASCREGRPRFRRGGLGISAELSVIDGGVHIPLWHKYLAFLSHVEAAFLEFSSARAREVRMAARVVVRGRAGLGF
jgi:hypothetical protein